MTGLRLPCADGARTGSQLDYNWIIPGLLTVHEEVFTLGLRYGGNPDFHWITIFNVDSRFNVGVT